MFHFEVNHVRHPCGGRFHKFLTPATSRRANLTRPFCRSHRLNAFPPQRAPPSAHRKWLGRVILSGHSSECQTFLGSCVAIWWKQFLVVFGPFFFLNQTPAEWNDPQLRACSVPRREDGQITIRAAHTTSERHRMRTSPRPVFGQPRKLGRHAKSTAGNEAKQLRKLSMINNVIIKISTLQ